jgi:hypothetical protein
MEPPKAISLFSGCGGDSLGLEKAGFKVVAFNEFKSAPISTHLANFPDSVLLKDSNGATDITKIPDSVFEAYKDISVVFAGFPCFVKGTLVLTDSGYKEIEEVSLNDKLFTHMGRFRNIVNLQMKSYSKEIWGPTKKLGGTEDLKKQIAHKKQNPEVCLRRDDRVLQY